MKSLGFLLLVAGIALAATPALAQSSSFTLNGEMVGGTYVWTDASGAQNPALSVTPGATITVNVDSKDGFHAFQVLAPVNAKSDDVDSTGTKTTTFTFTAPASGTATYDCPYHTTMKGTMTFGAASATVTPTQKAPGVPVLGVAIAMIGAALLIVRRT
jgi:plastocyanin